MHVLYLFYVFICRVERVERHVVVRRVVIRRAVASVESKLGQTDSVLAG
jgi:hypothetical protein